VLFRSEEAEGRAAGADSVAVELRNMPLLMHAAWQEHAAALLRELMLIRLEDDMEAIEHHASASDALSILFEQVPSPDPGEDPEAIMAGATEPGVSAPSLHLQIPPDSLPHFYQLEDAVRMAELGEQLSPPTQPEVRIMRKWLCQEIRSQASGRDASAWVSPTDARPPETSGPLDWDPAHVSTSARSLIAADDTNRILAVSAPAAAWLGYADKESLVGQRLISIIPTRYHQAHIAGFTLHLVNGRSPLLGTRVRVPVLRADGSEVDTELLVEARSMPHGRRLFTAEFFS
jgi:PAS domain S-box-containing protein